MLNGVPRNDFDERGGVRQGDPLSPLLFVLVVDLLQTILNDALDQGLIFNPTDIVQLQHLKSILDEFALSTGLKVNFHKSNIYPINVPQDYIAELTSRLQCQSGVFPFTYPGLPLGLFEAKNGAVNSFSHKG